MYLIVMTNLLAASASASPLILVDHLNGSAVNFALFGGQLQPVAGLAESGPNFELFGGQLQPGAGSAESGPNFELFGGQLEPGAGSAETGPNCAAIGCLVELCPNGQLPPVPTGRCCPSALLCPREDCPALPCPTLTCPDGRKAPTPAGKCCPDPGLCDRERLCASQERGCKQEYCSNGELAPVPEGSCCPSASLCPLQHCQGISCPPKRCPLTGDLAPIPRNSCCPSHQQCDNTNCSQVRCIVSRCPDGSIAPVPAGQCCPSLRACPGAQYTVITDEETPSIPATATATEGSYRKGTDCSMVTCYMARCPSSNMVAPVPWGNCCPNIRLCPLDPALLLETVSPHLLKQSVELF